MSAFSAPQHVRCGADFSPPLGRLSAPKALGRGEQFRLSAFSSVAWLAAPARHWFWFDGDRFAPSGGASNRFPGQHRKELDGVTVVPVALTGGERVSAMTTLVATIDRSPFQERTISDSRATHEPCACGLALAGHGEAYNEEAFHHFLAIERKRSEASGRPFLLLLVEFEQRPGVTLHIDRQCADRIFAGLAEGLRDTDVIGWYRHNRIAGAVLTDLGDAPEPTVRKQVTRRVTAALGGCVTGSSASVSQIRIYQLPARLDAASAATPIQQLEMA